MPTIEEIQDCQTIYSSKYPGDIYYHAATTLVERGIAQGRDNDGLREVTIGLAVLLVNWNTDFYRRFKGRLIDDSRYGRYLEQVELDDIRNIVYRHWQTLIEFRQLRIQDFAAKDENSIRDMFASFQAVIGPVGTAKGLHLFAPNFFPLWNNNIAKSYGINIENYNIDERPKLYCKFMNKIRNMLEDLLLSDPESDLSLKAIDEYNFIRY